MPALWDDVSVGLGTLYSWIILAQRCSVGDECVDSWRRASFLRNLASVFHRGKGENEGRTEEKGEKIIEMHAEMLYRSLFFERAMTARHQRRMWG